MDILKALAHYLTTQFPEIQVVVDNTWGGISLTANDHKFLDFSQRDNMVTITSVATIYYNVDTNRNSAHFVPCEMDLDMLDPEFLAKAAKIVDQWRLNGNITPEQYQAILRPINT